MTSRIIETYLSAYEILCVDPKTADDQVIRRAYLSLIRDCHPDNNPEQFQLIRAAYEQLKTGEQRTAYALFEVPYTGLPTLINALIKPGSPRLPTRSLLEAVLREGMQVDG